MAEGEGEGGGGWGVGVASETSGLPSGRSNTYKEFGTNYYNLQES